MSKFNTKPIRITADQMTDEERKSLDELIHGKTHSRSFESALIICGGENNHPDNENVHLCCLEESGCVYSPREFILELSISPLDRAIPLFSNVSRSLSRHPMYSERARAIFISFIQETIKKHADPNLPAAYGLLHSMPDFRRVVYDTLRRSPESARSLFTKEDAEISAPVGRPLLDTLVAEGPFNKKTALAAVGYETGILDAGEFREYIDRFLGEQP